MRESPEGTRSDDPHPLAAWGLKSACKPDRKLVKVNVELHSKCLEGAVIQQDYEILLSEWRDSMAQVNISDQVSYAVCRPSCKVTRLGRGDEARLQLQLVSGLLASPTRRHRRFFLVWLPAREPFPRPRVRFSFFLFGAPVCVGHAPAPGCSPGRKASPCSSRAAQSAPCAAQSRLSNLFV